MTRSSRADRAPRALPLLALGAALAVAVTGCTASSDPAPTITVTAAGATDPAPAATATTPAPAGAAAGTTTDLSTLVAEFVAARDALVAYKTAWTGGDLGSDPEFVTLRTALIGARQRLGTEVDWLDDTAASAAATGLPVSAQQAVQIGTDLVGADATVHDLDLDLDDDRLVWELDLRTASGVEHDLTIDAETGAVLEHDTDD
jgi:hypothetical protein